LKAVTLGILWLCPAAMQNSILNVLERGRGTASSNGPRKRAPPN